MNKEFVIIGDKVVVVDDGKLQGPIEYQDNVKEVLEQENRIDEIKKQLDELELLINDYSKDKKKNRIDSYFCIITILVTFFLCHLTGSFINNVAMSVGRDLTIVLPIFEVLGFTMSAIPILISIHFGSLDKKSERLYKGRKSEYECLSQKLQKEEEKLKILDKVKTKERISENQNNVVEIEEDEVFLEKLKNKKDLYYELGVKIDRYQKLLQKGKLREELSKIHNEEDAIFIEEIVSDGSKKKLEFTHETSNLK